MTYPKILRQRITAGELTYQKAFEWLLHHGMNPVRAWIALHEKNPVRAWIARHE
jgi:hypothetical protein